MHRQEENNNIASSRHVLARVRGRGVISGSRWANRRTATVETRVRTAFEGARRRVVRPSRETVVTHAALDLPPSRPFRQFSLAFRFRLFICVDSVRVLRVCSRSSVRPQSPRACPRTSERALGPVHSTSQRRAAFAVFRVRSEAATASVSRASSDPYDSVLHIVRRPAESTRLSDRARRPTPPFRQNEAPGGRAAQPTNSTARRCITVTTESLLLHFFFSLSLGVCVRGRAFFSFSCVCVCFFLSLFASLPRAPTCTQPRTRTPSRKERGSER